jgi:uncharacterized delta-60 repeat protein
MKLWVWAVAVGVAVVGWSTHAAASVHLDSGFGDGGMIDVSDTVSSPVGLTILNDDAIRLFGIRTGAQTYTAAALGLTADGRIDPGYGATHPGSTDLMGVGGFTQAIATVGDKTVFAATAADSGGFGGTQTVRLARVLRDGRLDPTFGSNGVVDTEIESYNGEVFAASMSDGRVLIATSAPPEPSSFDSAGMLVARFLADGTPDPTFSGDGQALVNDPQYQTTSPGPMTVLPDGDAIVAAQVYRSPAPFQYEVRSAFLRLNASGELVKGFGSGGFRVADSNYLGISDLTTDARGRLIAVGGAPVSGATGILPQIFAYDAATGKTVKSFADNGVATIDDSGAGALKSVVIAPNGSIVAAGQSNVLDYEDGGNNGDFLLVRLTSKGYPDRSFAHGGSFTADIAQGTEAFAALQLQSDGRIVVAGTHGYYYFRGPNTSQTLVAAYDPGPRRPDADRDGFVNGRDRCRRVVGEINGCPRLGRRVSLRRLGRRGFAGLVRADKKRCLRVAKVKLVRRRGATASVVGTDDELDHGRWEIDVPRAPGRYRATIARDYLPRAGVCAGARSAALNVNP